MQVSFKGLEYDDLKTYKALSLALSGSQVNTPMVANNRYNKIRKPVAKALDAMDKAAGSYDTVTIRYTEAVDSKENPKSKKHFLQVEASNGEIISRNYITTEDFDNKTPGSRLEDVFEKFAKDTEEYMKDKRHEPKTIEEIMGHFTHKYALDYRVLEHYRVNNITEYLNEKIRSRGKHFEPAVKIDNAGKLIDEDDID